MDRFIGRYPFPHAFVLWTLKSNMDRFIEVCSSVMTEYKSTLKSNMDRFIALQENFL